MNVGERLKHARSILDVNQGDFCDKIGLSHQSYLSDIENGRRPLSKKVAQRIEDVFNVSSYWLNTGEGSMMVDESNPEPTQRQNVESAGDRLRQWRTSKNLSQSEIAERVGYKQVAISAAESRGSVSRKLASKLEHTFSLSRVWLLEGIGNPEGHSLNIAQEPAPKYSAPVKRQPTGDVVKDILAVTVDSQGNENMVFVDAKAKAGYVDAYADPKYIQELPAVRIPGYENGTFRVFEVDGLSMHDTLYPGDHLICRYVDGLRAIKNDRVHVVVTKGGVLVKRVLNRIAQSGKVILTSDNKASGEYPPLVLEPEEILEIWYVQGRITRQLPPPSELYERVSALEGDVIELQMRLNK